MLHFSASGTGTPAEAKKQLEEQSRKMAPHYTAKPKALVEAAVDSAVAVLKGLTENVSVTVNVTGAIGPDDVANLSISANITPGK